jgi:hypothetical protein
MQRRPLGPISFLRAWMARSFGLAAKRQRAPMRVALMLSLLSTKYFLTRVWRNW